MILVVFITVSDRYEYVKSTINNVGVEDTTSSI